MTRIVETGLAVSRRSLLAGSVAAAGLAVAGRALAPPRQSRCRSLRSSS
ncbi:hypothetical protein [Novosphingobium sp. ST904]|nr:hypothetical protein [Novosphingobium sp. ST904]